MKTQISNLIDGGNVCRMTTHPKYEGKNMNNIAGTNSIVRAEIADKVKSENNNLIIELFGNTYELTRYTSCSGKTISWSGEISEDDFAKLTQHGGVADTYQAKYSLYVSGDCCCSVASYTRKNEASQWKEKTRTKIDTAFITIL